MRAESANMYIHFLCKMNIDIINEIQYILFE